MKSRTQSLASIFLVWDQNPLIAMFLPFLMFSCGDILGGVLVLTGSIKGLYKKNCNAKYMLYFLWVICHILKND